MASSPRSASPNGCPAGFSPKWGASLATWDDGRGLTSTSRCRARSRPRPAVERAKLDQLLLGAPSCGVDVRQDRAEPVRFAADGVGPWSGATGARNALAAKLVVDAPARRSPRASSTRIDGRTRQHRGLRALRGVPRPGKTAGDIASSPATTSAGSG
jgi:hypothetical protein